MHDLNHMDVTSVRGAIITILFASLQIADLDVAMRILAACIACVAGITTIIYNRKKIKELKNKQ